MPNWRITLATDEADWDWLLPHHLAVCRASTRDGQLDQEAESHLLEQAALIRQRLPNVVYIARAADGTRVGFVWVAIAPDEFTAAPRAFVLMLYVDPSQRRTGLGRKLLETAEDWGRAQGLDRIALSVAAHNATASALYAAMGYQPEQITLSKSLLRR